MNKYKQDTAFRGVIATLKKNGKSNMKTTKQNRKALISTDFLYTYLEKNSRKVSVELTPFPQV